MTVLRWAHISDIHIRASGEMLAKYNSSVVLDALWRDIADLITEGYTTGYERPVGINWTLNTED